MNSALAQHLTTGRANRLSVCRDKPDGGSRGHPVLLSDLRLKQYMSCTCRPVKMTGRQPIQHSPGVWAVTELDTPGERCQVSILYRRAKAASLKS